jgi:DNA-binding CsgD family transcriptional regulator
VFATKGVSGADPKTSRAPDRRDELNPQDMQIARLVAEGLTNRKIGEKLFLSHRMIGSHLYRIFPNSGSNPARDSPWRSGKCQRNQIALTAPQPTK